MATWSKRGDDNIISIPPNSCNPKPNLWQRLRQLLCGRGSFPTNDHDYSSLNGGSYVGVYNEQPTYKDNDMKAHEQPNQKVGRSKGIYGDGSETTDHKHPVNFGNSDWEAETKTSDSHKAAQPRQNEKETSNGRPADNTWEQPAKSKIKSPEKPKEAIDINGMYKNLEPPKVIIRSFDQQSETQQKEGDKQGRNGESQTKKIIGGVEQAGFQQGNGKQKDVVKQPDLNRDNLFPINTGNPYTTKSSVTQEVDRQPSINRDHKFTGTNHTKTTTSGFGLEFVRHPSFKKDEKYGDASFPKPTKSSAATHVKDDKHADASFSKLIENTSEHLDTSPLPTAISSSAPQIVRQTSFKDKKYAESNPPTTIESSSAPQIVRQTSFNDKKYADTSPPPTAKSSVVPQIIRQTSLNDKKYADTSPPRTAKSSVVPQVVKQTSFNDYKFAETTPPITPKSSVLPVVVTQTSYIDNTCVDSISGITTTNGGDTHKYSDTSTLATTKSSFTQNIVRQTSFNEDSKYRNANFEKNVVTDTNYQPKTSKNIVGHTSVEQQKGNSKQGYYNENQVIISSSMFAHISIHGQGGQNRSQYSVAEPKDLDKDVNTRRQNHTGGNKNTGHASEEQDKGVHKQDESDKIDSDTRPDHSR